MKGNKLLICNSIQSRSKVWDAKKSSRNSDLFPKNRTFLVY